ncbi:MAG: DUF4388 domain-containing protein [candidate division Zixibacteria bacterium]|nr:DUF4388 domain-containing protein [candidate division Zixibacteria bacterium]
MGLTGNLKTVSFSDVLQLLSTGKKTGTLTVASGVRKKEISFREGNIIYAFSVNSNEDLLGNLLLKRGKIGKKDLERAITLHKQSGRALGATLVDMELFDKEEVADCLRMQIEEIVYNLFSWSDGEFSFLEGQTPKNVPFMVNLSTMNIIMEGTRRIDEWMEIQKVLPPNDVLLRIRLLTHVTSDQVTLSLDEFKILALVNGERTLPDMIACSPIGEFPTCRAAYRLIVAGLVESAGRSTAAPSGLGPNENEEEIILGIIFKLYNASFLKIRKVFESIVGTNNSSYGRLASGNRQGIMVFFPGCDVQADSGPSFQKFLEEVRKIPEEVRLHRVLTLLESMLNEQLEYVFLQLGQGPFREAVGRVKKEISEPLAVRRELVKKFRLDDNFYDMLHKTERTIKIITGVS